MVRQRPAKPCTRVRFPSPPLIALPCAVSSAGERFPDTEEVAGSIPVPRTSIVPVQSRFPTREGPTRTTYAPHSRISQCPQLTLMSQLVRDAPAASTTPKAYRRSSRGMLVFYTLKSTLQRRDPPDVRAARAARAQDEDCDYDGGDDRNWMTSRSGSGDVATLPMNGCESSKTRNRLAATSTPTVATIV